MIESVIIVFNIQSNTNIGQIIRTANAFGVKEIAIVGRKKASTFGSHKTTAATRFRHFYQIEAAVDYYRSSGFNIMGVEITDDAVSVNEVSFDKSTVFILGNEGSGLQSKIIALCDGCVFIPQFGSTASVNVNVACGIVLNVFTRERKDYNSINGEKFMPR